MASTKIDESDPIGLLALCFIAAIIICGVGVFIYYYVIQGKEIIDKTTDCFLLIVLIWVCLWAWPFLSLLRKH